MMIIRFEGSEAEISVGINEKGNIEFTYSPGVGEPDHIQEITSQEALSLSVAFGEFANLC